MKVNRRRWSIYCIKDHEVADAVGLRRGDNSRFKNITSSNGFQERI